MELGVFDVLDLMDVEIVFVCVFYNGEEIYVNVVCVMLMKVGFLEDDLECGL